MIDPPREVRELEELNNAECPCSMRRANRFKCLLCGDALCSNCFYEHKNQHGRRNLYLELDYYMQMKFEAEGKWGAEDIYENEFHIPYSQSYHG